MIDINNPIVVEYLDKLIQKKLDNYLKNQDKRYVGIVKSVGAGTVTVNLPNEIADIVVQNINEVPCEIGDQVTIMAYKNDLSNAVIENRKAITLNNIYVDYNTGVDSYGSNSSGYQYGTQNAPFKTLQYAISRLPKNLNNRNILIHYLNPNSSETLDITNFYGGGTLTIYPYSSATISYIDYIFIFGCVGVEIDIYNLGATNLATSPRRAAIWIRNSSYIVLDTCNVTSPSEGIGISIDDGSRATVRNTNVSNRGYGILVESISWCFSQNNSGTGNIYGLQAVYSSHIGKSGTQPEGTTSEVKDSSSIIQ